MAYCLRSFAETLDQVLHPQKYRKNWILDHEHVPQIQSLFENATFLQNFLDKSSPQIQDKIASLEDQIMDAAQNAADTLETYITDQILLNPMDQSFTIFPPDLGEVIRVFEDAKQDVIKIGDASQPSEHIMSHSDSSRHYPDAKNTVVGMEEDLNQLRSRLTSAKVPELDVIPIVGMGGMGKTTLARILYDEFSSGSKPHFDRCAWVTVSQTYDPQKILKTILASVTGKLLSEIPQQQTSELIVSLYQTLVGRRYLIVLDDIWSSEAWDDVQRSFARDNQGSRVIFTTREKSLVDYVKSNSHEMHLINDDKSWELLRRKVFGEESCPRQLVEVGKRIALKCGGLPLALQVIGGLLAHSEKSEDFWKYVEHNVSSLIATTNDQFAGILSWSFAHLPHHLKPCFLYMGAFPEDEWIPSSKIIKLWVAEGFLCPVPNKTLEEAAKMYLKALVDRNLIFVRRRRWNGKAESYGIHDLLRDLCLKKSQEKEFLHYIKDSKADIFQEDISGVRRVSVHFDEECHGSLKLTSLARSFLFTGSGASDEFLTRLCYESLLLRVLCAYDQTAGNLQKLILHLVNLRYLDIKFCYYESARNFNSRDIYVLTNLQTLTIDILESLEILDHLPQLRHLQFLELEDDNSLEIYPHENLQCLSYVPISVVTCLLEKIPNLRKLEVSKHSYHSYDSVVDLTCFQKLERLSFTGSYPNLTLPPSLKRLELTNCQFSKTLPIPAEIGNLPRLQALKLSYCKFENGTWEPSEDEFCQLQYLYVQGSNLENWIADAIHFPVLRHLRFDDCRCLLEIPDDIGGIVTLQSIELDVCKDSVFDSARRILDEQLQFDNTLLQLQLGRSSDDIENMEAAKELKSFERKTRNHALKITGKSSFSTKTVFPRSLRNLKLKKCQVSQTIFRAMGVLPELQVLILEKCYLRKELRHLEIKDGYLLYEWLDTEVHFPVLKQLVIKKCKYLNGIPIGIGRIETLEVIEVEKCKPPLVNSARMMLEEQRKLGNTLLQLRLDGVLVDEKEE